MNDPFAAEKRVMRKRLRQARAALSEAERASMNAALGAHAAALLRTLDVGNGHCVALFAASPTEAEPSGILETVREIGATALYPRVSSDDVLQLFELQPGMVLEPGYRNIPEPPRSAQFRDPACVAAILVPGLGFDRAGHRLGQGGGHYDRLLATLRPTAVRIGVAWHLQIEPHIPVAPHDAPLDIILSDRGVVARVTRHLSATPPR